jgi:hypothetical protein
MTKTSKPFALTAISFGDHMTYLLCTTATTTISTTAKRRVIDVIQLDTHGAVVTHISAAFSRCVRAMCMRLSMHGICFRYLSSADYWKYDFHIGQFYPGAALCVSLPRILMELITVHGVEPIDLAKNCVSLARAQLDAYMLHFARLNRTLDVLLDTFESWDRVLLSNNSQDHWLYGLTRRSLDIIYSTIVEYMGLNKFPSLVWSDGKRWICKRKR